jgi:putative ABC transport system permease protein
MVFVGVVSIRLSLGIEKSLAVATLRTYVQLFILGLVLRWVFGIDSPWLVLALLLVMVAAAARTIVRRAPDAPRGIFGSSFVSMLLTGFIVTFAVTGLVVQVEPWYRAQYVIPIAGMVLGNSICARRSCWRWWRWAPRRGRRPDRACARLSRRR